MKWVNKNEKKIYKETFKKSSVELANFVENELNRQISMRNSDGSINRAYINAYNKKLADVMNKNVGDISAPSGRLVKYVAKRGDVGVYTALADAGYDMSQVKNGVWNSGRIAYRKNTVETR